MKEYVEYEHDLRYGNRSPKIIYTGILDGLAMRGLRVDDFKYMIKKILGTRIDGLTVEQLLNLWKRHNGPIIQDLTEEERKSVGKYVRKI